MTEWASSRLARAYALIEAEQKEQAQPSGSPITASLRDAMDAVELADCELVDAA